MLVLLALPVLLFAQQKAANAEIEVSAKITDVSGAPVEGAVITAVEGRYVVQSDRDGSFNVLSGVDDYIFVEAPGFVSRLVFVSELAAAQGTIALQPENYMEGKNDQVSVAFGTQSKRRIVGAVSNIRMDDYKDIYNDRNFWTLVNANGLGMFSASDVRGLGGATILIDGLVRDSWGSIVNLSDMLNADEIEEITILKDATSKMLYGTLANAGVIMLKTRRGEAHKRKMNFTYESGFGVPVSYPGYLKAADYMILYNEALDNDGLPSLYSYNQIDNTRKGDDPIAYPDVDYYRGNTFLNSFKPQQRFQGEFTGGNEAAQYYLNLGYMNTQSLLKEGEGSKQSTNRFNVHGAVDVKLTDYIKVTLDGTAIFNAYHGPKWKTFNFWNLTTTERVNAYPLLIPIERISADNDEIIAEAHNQRSIIDGAYVLGGQSSFRQNNWQNIYGDLNLGGYENTMDRLMNVNLGFDVDLKNITKGLVFRSYFGTDHYNRYAVSQDNEYAIYNPNIHSDGVIVINKEGNNDFVGRQNMSGVSFSRRYGWTNALAYDNTFADKHDISLTLNSIYYTYKESGTRYTDRNINFGFRANYMYDKRYIAEYSSAYIGSSYLKVGNRWGYAQSLGAAWIMSEEDFLRDVSGLDYLKFKASWGNTKSDRSSGFGNYHLFENTYSVGSAYNYGDGDGSNSMMSVGSGNPNLSFAQSSSLNAGFESSLIGRKIFIEVNYFNTLHYDVVQRLTSSYPAYLGGSAFVPSENYGRMRDNGVEAGINFRQKFGEFTLGAGLNAIWYSSEVLRTNEDDYGQGMEYRQAAGKSNWAVWGLQADGLYTRAEAERINDPSANVARPTFGIVRAGDIKYIDQNNDNKIDDDDLTVIGSSHATANYSLTLNASWRNFNLWACFDIQTGRNTIDGGITTYEWSEGTNSNSYPSDYYWVYGEMKYPVHLLRRWTKENPNVDASYPRLTVSETGNNYRNSTYWLSNKNYFSMPAIQLSYTFGKRIANAMAMKDAMIFVRANNLFKIGPNADIQQLNVGSEPQLRWYYIGVKTQF